MLCIKLKSKYKFEIGHLQQSNYGFAGNILEQSYGYLADKFGIMWQVSHDDERDFTW